MILHNGFAYRRADGVDAGPQVFVYWWQEEGR